MRTVSALWVLLFCLTTPTTVPAQSPASSLETTPRPQSCLPLNVENLQQGNLTLDGLVAMATADQPVHIDSYKILCEGVVSGCVGPALLVVVEYRCLKSWCAAGEGEGRGVQVFQACCVSPPWYNLTTDTTQLLADRKGKCLGSEVITGLAAGLTTLSILTLLLGMGLGAFTYYCYHTHRHAHTKQEGEEPHTYLPMKSVNSGMLSSQGTNDDILIYDLPETSKGTDGEEGLAIMNKVSSTMNKGPSTTNIPSLLGTKEEEEQFATDEDSDDLEEAEEEGILKYTNITLKKTLPVKGGSQDDATTHPHFVHRILSQTASCDDLGVYDDTITLKQVMARSLDQGLDSVGIGRKGEGLESMGGGAGVVPGGEGRGYVGIVPPQGVVIHETKQQEERLYEDVGNINFTSSWKEGPKISQKYDYVSYPDGRFSATHLELRKNQATPTQDKATPTKVKTLPARGNKPKLPSKPSLLKHGRNSLPITTPIQHKGEGLKGRGMGGKGHSHGEIGLKGAKGRGREGQRRDAKVPFQILTPEEGQALTDECEYITSDLGSSQSHSNHMTPRSHDSHMIQESEGYVVTNYNQQDSKGQSTRGQSPLYEEVDKTRMSGVNF